MTSKHADRCWAVIPAAGSARRMGEAAAPKQYLSIAGRSALEWAAAPFLNRSDCAGLVIVLASDDAHWRDTALANNPRVLTAVGGPERMHSVFAGLEALARRATERDWVLVHDAARPCLSGEDLERLITTLAGDEVGGLLAAPVVDTLKRADGAERVAETVPRERLWRALTPQMFRYGLLRDALVHATTKNIMATDEAQAIEAFGKRPRLVCGDADNLKITTPADLERAERILHERSERCAT